MKRSGDSDGARLLRFAKLVKGMRDQQARYYRGDRSPQRIKLAKDYERRVDAAVAWILGDRSRQRLLFRASDEERPGAYDAPRD